MDGLTEGVGSLGDVEELELQATNASDIPADRNSTSIPPPFFVSVPLPLLQHVDGESSVAVLL